VTRTGCVALLVAFTAAAAAAGPGEPFARARVDSSSYRVGDWIHVFVELQHPRGAAFRPVFGDTVNGFTVIERLAVLPQSDTTTRTGVVVARYDSGQAVLPGLEYAVSIPGDSARIVVTNALVLTVHTVPVDTSKDFRDLKPPLSIPLSTAEVLMYSGIVLALLAAAFLGYRYWKRRRGRKAAGEDAPPVPARPAHIIALEELAILKERKLWQQGHVKEFHSAITEIFRRYLENRYSMMALEETTDEIMDGMRKLRFPDHMLADAEKILRRADLVKFAKYQPVVTEHEEMFTVVREIVEKTKIVQMTPVSVDEVKAAAHAGT